MTGEFAPLRDCPKDAAVGAGPPAQPVARCRGDPGRGPDRTPTLRSRSDLELPSYRVLDEIVERFIELGEGVVEIEAAGFERKTVENVIDLIIGAERKRDWWRRG